MTSIIDSHIHLNAPDYQEGFEEHIQEAKDLGCEAFVCIGAGYGTQSAKGAYELSKKYDCIYPTAGIHPHDAGEKIHFQEIEELAKDSKVVAVGETGLDYFKNYAPKDKQEHYFRKQIELAHEVNKPLIIHSRDAAKDCLAILKEMEADKVGGVFHCYSEDANFAKQLKEINFIVSFPGTITFKKAEQVREAAREIPLEQIMLETDGPFLAPEPYRGKLCRPAYIVETAKKLAELKNMSLDELVKITTETTKKFYKID